MSTQVATEIPGVAVRRSARVRVIATLGPLTATAGAVWAILQPWRLTLLHPHGQGFWWLFAEPPLFVVLAAAVFHVLVAPGLVRDLEESESPTRAPGAPLTKEGVPAARRTVHRRTDKGRGRVILPLSGVRLWRSRALPGGSHSRPGARDAAG
jgi:hypothetical protein